MLKKSLLSLSALVILFNAASVLAQPPPPSGIAVDGQGFKNCGRDVLHQYDDCCQDQDELIVRGQGLSGRLPGSFTSPRLRLDTRDSPALCGVVRQLPSESLFLSNSGVMLDLNSIHVPFFGPKLITMLGAGDLTGANLNGPLAFREAVQVCMLFDEGTVAIPVEGASSCTDGSQTRIFSQDANAAKAFAQYNGHMKLVDANMQCGAEGKKGRMQTAVVTWVVVLFLLVPLGVVGLCRRRYCCLLGWTRPLHFGKAVGSLQVFGCLAITILDWLNFFEIAATGQTTATYRMSWVMLATYTFIPMLLIAVAIVFASVMMKRHIEYSALIASNCCPIMAVLLVLAAVFSLIGIRAVLVHPTYTTPTLCMPNTLHLFTLIICFSLPALFAFITLLVMLKILHSPYVVKLHLILAAVFILVKGLIMGVSQGMLWSSGIALMPTIDFAVPAVCTCIGVVLSLMTLLDKFVNPAPPKADADITNGKTLTMLTDFYPTPSPRSGGQPMIH